MIIYMKVRVVVPFTWMGQQHLRSYKISYRFFVFSAAVCGTQHGVYYTNSWCLITLDGCCQPLNARVSPTFEYSRTFVESCICHSFQRHSLTCFRVRKLSKKISRQHFVIHQLLCSYWKFDVFSNIRTEIQEVRSLLSWKWVDRGEQQIRRMHVKIVYDKSLYHMMQYKNQTTGRYCHAKSFVTYRTILSTRNSPTKGTGNL